jgi:nucleotide-binding universal stress UspA family protein
MNEILVASDEVATGSQLAEHAASFADWRDRMFWKRIKVRKLK